MARYFVKPPLDLLEYIEATSGDLAGVERVVGGDINHAARIVLRNGQTLFVKWVDSQPVDFLAREADGLRLLRLQAATLVVPEVLAVKQFANGTQCLVLQYLKSVPPTRTAWRALGEGLAAMHSQRGPHFGLDHSNYIGSLPQFNGQEATWPLFFARQRLLPQLEAGLKAAVFGSAFAKKVHWIVSNIGALLPDADPELMHGDLWSGNVMFTERGPALVDPAVVWGSGEADLAMSRLFGGFDPAFYEGYQSVKPYIPELENRIPLYQLYWLMVHANLFGGHYVDRCSALVSSKSWGQGRTTK